MNEKEVIYEKWNIDDDIFKGYVKAKLEDLGDRVDCYQDFYQRQTAALNLKIYLVALLLIFHAAGEAGLWKLLLRGL